MNTKFKIGDTVSVDLDSAFDCWGSYERPENPVGVVVGFSPTHLLISFPNWTNGHSGRGLTYPTGPVDPDSCWYVTEDNITLIEPTDATVKFKVGDRVQITNKRDEPPYLAAGEISEVGYSRSIVLVRFDSWNEGHGDDGRNWWIDVKNLRKIDNKETEQMTFKFHTATVAPKIPHEVEFISEVAQPVTAATKKPFRKGTQNYILLQHLSSGRTLTRITADHLYRVASLTTRISQLRQAGHDIDPPPLKWSTLRYVFGQKEDRQCRESATSRKRSLQS